MVQQHHLWGTGNIHEQERTPDEILEEGISMIGGGKIETWEQNEEHVSTRSVDNYDMWGDKNTLSMDVRRNGDNVVTGEGINVLETCQLCEYVNPSDFASYLILPSSHFHSGNCLSLCGAPLIIW